MWEELHYIDFCSCTTESDSVVSVFESKTNRLSTTHSWDFLGLDSIPQYNQMPMDSKSNVIVGVIDTGIASIFFLIWFFSLYSFMMVSLVLFCRSLARVRELQW